MTETIRDLLIEEMQDLYDAEKQLVKALPKMAKAASNEDLSEAFTGHLQQTRGQVERLERAFQALEMKPKSKPCVAMKGLIDEAQEQIDGNEKGAIADSAMICAAQKVEHYEIAGYGTLKTWAEELGLDDVAALLQETLDEEKEADEKLSVIAGRVLSDSMNEESDAPVETVRSARSHR